MGKEEDPPLRTLGRPGRRSDSRITEDIRRLLHERLRSGQHIEVAVHRGAVRLSGHALTRSQRWLAEELAERVAGVEGVENVVRIVR